MKRRTFIKGSSALAIPGMIGGLPMSALSNSTLSSLINGDTDRVLVLVQLIGGNDGLSTLVPLDQLDNLAQVRSNMILPENQLQNITDTLAFHPVMSGFKDLYEDARMNIVQSVAYPNQDRSHFRSTDIWHTGSAAEDFLETGWVGRYFENRFPNFPADYPNGQCPDPFALTIGNSVSETCQGITGNFSLAINDPMNLNQLSSPSNNAVANGCAADNLDFLTTAIQQTNLYSEVITERFEQGNNLSSLYADDNQLAQSLRTVARLISGGLNTRVYIVSLGGFDTHANQVDGDTASIGQHANLLNTLSTAIHAFQDDLAQLGIDDRVLGMTYSEFGRRIRSNASLGTDHGTAAPLFVFGKCVNAGIVGTNVEVPPDADPNEGVPMQYDFRSIYGSVLMDWFEVEEDEVNQIFPNLDFQYIPIANSCATVSTDDPEIADAFNSKVWPNPFDQSFTISFEHKSDWIKVSVFNSLGSEVKVLKNGQLAQGLHQIQFDMGRYPAGAYFIRIQSKLDQKTIRVIKS